MASWRSKGFGVLGVVLLRTGLSEAVGGVRGIVAFWSLLLVLVLVHCGVVRWRGARKNN